MEFLVEEDKKDAKQTIEDLQLKKLEQIKLVRKGQREERACVIEVTHNIDDLEWVTK